MTDGETLYLSGSRLALLEFNWCRAFVFVRRNFPILNGLKKVLCGYAVIFRETLTSPVCNQVTYNPGYEPNLHQAVSHTLSLRWHRTNKIAISVRSSRRRPHRIKYAEPERHSRGMAMCVGVCMCEQGFPRNLVLFPTGIHRSGMVYSNRSSDIFRNEISHFVGAVCEKRVFFVTLCLFPQGSTGAAWCLVTVVP